MGRKPLPFPEQGNDADTIFTELKKIQSHDVKWEQGRVFAYVYHYTDELKAFVKEVNNMFFSTNGLNPLAFPSLKQFEAEVVSMVADLFHGDHRVFGNITSGGTESILLAVKTYRDWAKKKFPQIIKPEMILPISAHAAFNKAAHYFGVIPVYVPLDEKYHADLNAVRAALSPNTILIIGSACDFPKGGMDPIIEMANIAQERGIGFHTDACLGGFMLPFLRDLGYSIPEFDFNVPGVTSISADIHKYGHGPKGSSILLFRNERFWKNQFHAYGDWPGGVFGSPTMMGTRPGGVIAAAWATLKKMGRTGYLDASKRAKNATERLIIGISQIPELKVLGEPIMTAFAFTFTTPELNIYALGDVLMSKGWFLDKVQFPMALHLLVNPFQDAFVEEFLKDLSESIAIIKSNPQKANEGEAAMYGMMATINDRAQLEDLVIGFLADQYKLK